jgi:cytochrome c biogenesis protein CcmG, thiol:disulfide interchange protein DsbE
MATDTLTSPSPAPDEPARPPRRRLHPLVVGTVAAVLSVGAGTAAALVYGAMVDEPAEVRPEPEVVLRFTPDQDESDRPQVTGGAPLPDERFPDLDGTMRSFADYRGTPLVVNFWASSCAPCIKEMPDLERVHQELGGEVAFLGIAVRDQVADSQRMIDETGVTYDIGRDPSGALLTELGGVALPSTFFVAADGTVAHIATGALSLEDIRERVEALRA